MSISEFELKNASVAPNSTTTLSPPSDRGPPENQVWDARINGIMTDFKGELSQLDPSSGSSLDLQDPSRRAALAKTDRPTLITHTTQLDHSNNRSFTPSPVTSPTPTVILRPSSEMEQESVKSSPSSPINDPSLMLPPHVSTLQTPPRAHTTPTLQASGPKSVPTIRSRTVNSFAGIGTQTHNPPRDTPRLRIQHRSTASNSEPSLVRDLPEPHASMSFNQPGSYIILLNSDAASPVLTIGSQQDLTTNDLVLNRFASSLSPPGDGDSDIQTRGKELATRCWAEDEEFLQKEKIAEWLGGQ
jgi:PH/SEC7 domain-containing protein